MMKLKRGIGLCFNFRRGWISFTRQGALDRGRDRHFSMYFPVSLHSLILLSGFISPPGTDLTGGDSALRRQSVNATIHRSLHSSREVLP